ncbi:MAG: hypothetical protein AABW68_04695, partial [archaeon]
MTEGRSPNRRRARRLAILRETAPKKKRPHNRRKEITGKNIATHSSVKKWETLLENAQHELFVYVKQNNPADPAINHTIHTMIRRRLVIERRLTSIYMRRAILLIRTAIDVSKPTPKIEKDIWRRQNILLSTFEKKDAALNTILHDATLFN